MSGINPFNSPKDIAPYLYQNRASFFANVNNSVTDVYPKSPRYRSEMRAEKESRARSNIYSGQKRHDNVSMRDILQHDLSLPVSLPHRKSQRSHSEAPGTSMRDIISYRDFDKDIKPNNRVFPEASDDYSSFYFGGSCREVPLKKSRGELTSPLPSISTLGNDYPSPGRSLGLARSSSYTQNCVRHQRSTTVPCSLSTHSRLKHSSFNDSFIPRPNSTHERIFGAPSHVNLRPSTTHGTVGKERENEDRDERRESGDKAHGVLFSRHDESGVAKEGIMVDQFQSSFAILQHSTAPDPFEKPYRPGKRVFFSKTNDVERLSINPEQEETLMIKSFDNVSNRSLFLQRDTKRLSSAHVISSLNPTPSEQISPSNKDYCGEQEYSESRESTHERVIGIVRPLAEKECFGIKQFSIDDSIIPDENHYSFALDRNAKGISCYVNQKKAPSCFIIEDFSKADLAPVLPRFQKDKNKVGNLDVDWYPSKMVSEQKYHTNHIFTPLVNEPIIKKGRKKRFPNEGKGQRGDDSQQKRSGKRAVTGNKAVWNPVLETMVSEQVPLHYNCNVRIGERGITTTEGAETQKTDFNKPKKLLANHIRSISSFRVEQVLHCNYETIGQQTVPKEKRLRKKRPSVLAL